MDLPELSDLPPHVNCSAAVALTLVAMHPGCPSDRQSTRGCGWLKQYVLKTLVSS